MIVLRSVCQAKKDVGKPKGSHPGLLEIILIPPPPSRRGGMGIILRTSNAIKKSAFRHSMEVQTNRQRWYALIEKSTHFCRGMALFNSNYYYADFSIYGVRQSIYPFSEGIRQSIYPFSEGTVSPKFNIT